MDPASIPFLKTPPLRIPPLRNFKHWKVDLSHNLKDMTNCALLIAASRSGDTTLRDVLFSEDTRVMINCLRLLGYEIWSNGNEITMRGREWRTLKPQADLLVGATETATIFLLALLSLRGNGEYTLKGSDAMWKRPLKEFLEVFKNLGCEFTWVGEEWHFPFTMKTHGIKANSVSMPASATSQILSALLLIATYIATPQKPFSVKLHGGTAPCPSVDMVIQMICTFGGIIGEPVENRFVCCENCNVDGSIDYFIQHEGLLPSCCAMLPFVHRESKVELLWWFLGGGKRNYVTSVFGWPTLDHGLLSVRAEGFSIQTTVSAGTWRKGFRIDFKPISDVFFPLVAGAPLLEVDNPTPPKNRPTPLEIAGIGGGMGERGYEIIDAAVENLKKIVGEDNVMWDDDSLTVYPCGLESIQTRASCFPDKVIPIKTYGDPWIAMSFAILGTYDMHGDGSPWLSIQSPVCYKRTFLHFLDVLRKDPAEYTFM